MEFVHEVTGDKISRRNVLTSLRWKLREEYLDQKAKKLDRPIDIVQNIAVEKITITPPLSAHKDINRLLQQMRVCFNYFKT